MWGLWAGPLLFMTQMVHHWVVSPVLLSVWVCFRGTCSFRRGCCLTGNCKWVCLGLCCNLHGAWCLGEALTKPTEPRPRDVALMHRSCNCWFARSGPRWDVSLGRQGVVINWRISSTYFTHASSTVSYRSLFPPQNKKKEKKNLYLHDIKSQLWV